MIHSLTCLGIYLCSARPSLWLSWQKIHLQCWRLGFNPWAGKIPWRRERLPTAVFWPGEWSRRIGHDWATFTFSFTTLRYVHPSFSPGPHYQCSPFLRHSSNFTPFMSPSSFGSHKSPLFYRVCIDCAIGFEYGCVYLYSCVNICISWIHG